VSDIWFSSDFHMGHRNVVGYCKRPFLFDYSLGFDDKYKYNFDVDLMDETIIANYNHVVKPQDTVYLLGDIMMGSNTKERMPALRKRLNGNITVVLGNHDKSAKFMLECGFDQVVKEIDTAIDGKRVFMRHHPPERPEAKWGIYDVILVGHVHEKWSQRGKVINVGVDVRNFTPVNWKEIVKLIEDPILTLPPK
jgi:calcineurin-like phosphoesterase family protein